MPVRLPGLRGVVRRSRIRGAGHGLRTSLLPAQLAAARGGRSTRGTDAEVGGMSRVLFVSGGPLVGSYALSPAAIAMIPLTDAAGRLT